MAKVRVRLHIQQPQINQFLKDALDLTLSEGSTVVDMIKVADEFILKEAGGFPVKGFRSLLHMIYHPCEERFYKQVAIQAFTRPGTLLDVRGNPKMPLPDGVTVIIVPEGGCMAEWEEPVAP